MRINAYRAAKRRQTWHEIKREIKRELLPAAPFFAAAIGLFIALLIY